MLTQTDATWSAVLLQAAQRYSDTTGIDVVIDFEAPALVVRAAESELHVNAQARDGWILDGTGLVTLAAQSALLNLSQATQTNSQLQFPDVEAFWRGPASSYGQAVVSLPVHGRELLLFYRCAHVAWLRVPLHAAMGQPCDGHSPMRKRMPPLHGAHGCAA